MSDEIVWEDPPEIVASGGRPSVWLKRLNPLVEQPDRWARVAEYSNQGAARSAVTTVNTGRAKTPPGKWEAVSRTVDGHSYVYARYLGPEKEAE